MVKRERERERKRKAVSGFRGIPLQPACDVVTIRNRGMARKFEKPLSYPLEYEEIETFTKEFFVALSYLVHFMFEKIHLSPSRESFTSVLCPFSLKIRETKEG